MENPNKVYVKQRDMHEEIRHDQQRRCSIAAQLDLLWSNTHAA
jgi:hypothetical protein